MQDQKPSSNTYQITGFPSPCAEYHEPGLSLDQRYRLGHPGVFVIEVARDARTLGLKSGDKLVVDRSLTPRTGQLVVMVVANEFKLGPFVPEKLQAMDHGEGDFLWGVVTALVRELT